MDKLNWSRKKAANIIVGMGLIISMAYATNGGLLLLDLVDHFANNIGIMFGGFVEILLMTWLLNKIGDVREYVNSTSDFSIGQWFEICLRFVTPILIGIILVTKLNTLFTEGYGGYDLTVGWSLIVGLFIFGLAINKINHKEFKA
jgi:NSS family neurotransmitter:Na+ symporter